MGSCSARADRANYLGCSGCFNGFSRKDVVCSHTGTPLPQIQHLQVQRCDVCPGSGGRLVIVGDVHGCALELRRLLDHVSFKSCRDTLVLVGDLVNKGPRSAEVVQLARQLNALCVRGNHEDQVLEAWFRVGRYSAGVDSWSNKGLLDELSCDDIKWMQELPLSITFRWLGMIVVHAGLVPGRPLEAQDFKDLAWIRDLRKDHAGMWQGLQTPQHDSQDWASQWPGPEHIVFGHDAKRKLQQCQCATGLDTGCCYGFKLSALVVDPENFSNRHILQVEAEQMYTTPADKRS